MVPASYPPLPEYVRSSDEQKDALAIFKNTPLPALEACSASLGEIGKFIQDRLKADTEQFEETLKAYEIYDQIDPKMRLLLMSRRPFSQMFRDINTEPVYQNSYQAHFKNILVEKKI